MEICDSMCLTLCLYYLTSRETRLHILNQNPLKISYELTYYTKSCNLLVCEFEFGRQTFSLLQVNA